MREVISDSPKDFQNANAYKNEIKTDTTPSEDGPASDGPLLQVSEPITTSPAQATHSYAREVSKDSTLDNQNVDASKNDLQISKPY